VSDGSSQLIAPSAHICLHVSVGAKSQAALLDSVVFGTRLAIYHDNLLFALEGDYATRFPSGLKIG